MMNESEKLEQVRKWIADPFSDVELTDREREVITLASHGVSIITIANRTGTKRQGVYDAIWRAIFKITVKRFDYDLMTLDNLVDYPKERLCDVELADLQGVVFDLARRGKSVARIAEILKINNRRVDNLLSGAIQRVNKSTSTLRPDNLTIYMFKQLERITS